FTVGGVSYNTYSPGYASYNGGIGSPTTNYHSYIDNETFGFPVVAYNESNGSRNWKGSAIDIKGKAMENGPGTYTVSFDVFATGSGTKLYGGFYYFDKATGIRNFHSGQYWISVSRTNSWHRVYGTCKLGNNVDWSQGVSFYFYGSDF